MNETITKSDASTSKSIDSVKLGESSFMSHVKCNFDVESFYKQLSTSTVATSNRLDVRLVLKFVRLVLNFVSFYIMS